MSFSWILFVNQVKIALNYINKMFSSKAFLHFCWLTQTQIQVILSSTTSVIIHIYIYIYIYLITPFLTWSCRALRHLLTAGNRSVSAEKRCGSSVSTHHSPPWSQHTGMTNFPLFSLLFSFPTEMFYIYFTCIFTSVLHLFCLLVYLSILFYIHFLTHCFLSHNHFLQHKLLVPLFTLNLLCVVSGPAPDSAFSIFFFCVHFTPD